MAPRLHFQAGQDGELCRLGRFQVADKKSPGGPQQPLQEESIVARLKSASGGELAGLTSYTGLLGRSSKAGCWLLYPTLDMSTSLEIQESDIVHSESLAPEQSPFGGLGGTRVFVRKGAQVTSSRTVSRTSQAGAGDEFDLDVRVGQPASRRLGDQTAFCITGGFCSEGIRCSDTCQTHCNTCGTTCPQFNTCQTCPTQCGTCQTCPGQATCQTCETNCGTCHTNCGTCQTFCGTCPGDTCVACTHATCFEGCRQAQATGATSRTCFETCGGGCTHTCTRNPCRFTCGCD